MVMMVMMMAMMTVSRQMRDKEYLPTALIMHQHVNCKSVVCLLTNKVPYNFKHVGCFRYGIIQLSSNYIVWNIMELKFY